MADSGATKTTQMVRANSDLTPTGAVGVVGAVGVLGEVPKKAPLLHRKSWDAAAPPTATTKDGLPVSPRERAPVSPRGPMKCQYSQIQYSSPLYYHIFSWQSVQSHFYVSLYQKFSSVISQNCVDQG